MKPYQNKDGDSGVVAYDINEQSIVIRFRDGATYLYDYSRPGRKAVEEMKSLARNGIGLATYINQHIRAAYARKLEQ